MSRISFGGTKPPFRNCYGLLSLKLAKWVHISYIKEKSWVFFYLSFLDDEEGD